MADQATAAVAIVVGVGLALASFVFAAVTITRGMLGRSRRRRVVLPLLGIVYGWLFVALVLVYLEVAWKPSTLALVALAGFWGYVAASGLHSANKDARGGGRGE